MKLNCKPGDLAVVVRSETGNLGKLLTCLKLHPEGYFHSAPWLGPIWEVDRSDIVSTDLMGRNRKVNNLIPDENLRALRGDSGNESWFRAAPKSLLATTKGDTITNRGELA